jgi:hypothetical protein
MLGEGGSDDRLLLARHVRGRSLNLVSNKDKGRSVNRASLHLTRIRYVIAMTLLAGCVTPSKPTKPLLASRYYGTWRNAVAQWHNWWEISAAGAISYTYWQDGDCKALPMLVRGTDQVKAPPEDGKTERTVNLRLAEGDILLLVSDDFSGGAVHRRVDPSDICKRSDGTYAHGAPHPAKLG